MITVNKLIEHLLNMAKEGKGNYPVLMAGANSLSVYPLERGDIGKANARADNTIDLLDVLVLYPKLTAPSAPVNAIHIPGVKDG